MDAKKEHYNKGLDLFGEGKNQEAIVEYEKALEIDPDDGEIHMAISMSHQQMGDLDKALESAKKAVELDPREPLMYTNLSRIFVKKGMIHEAEEALAISRQLGMGMM
ncbi:MAG: tetratricopeptide repeat protein [Candidatus Omnitrophica bacterium]|nr:tetratricopeptide repeat protein [Candidatus Omnitrophota bacterium]